MVVVGIYVPRVIVDANSTYYIDSMVPDTSRCIMPYKELDFYFNAARCKAPHNW